MKKRVIIALAFSMGAFAFAQKKELRTAEKAIKGNNFAEAKTVLDQQVKPMLSTMDDKYKAEYYYLYGQALYANGAGNVNDFDAAIKSINNIENGYDQEVKELKQNIINKLLSRGNKAYENKEFASGSDYFEKIYRLSTKDTIYLYYAASMAVSAPDYDRALVLYEELKDLGYTGKETQYYATNKETNEEEVLDKSTRDLYVKAGSHIKPGKRLTDSKEPEIIKNIALIYVNRGDDEKAIAAIKEAREQNPDDINLILTEANAHYKMGNTKEFSNLLQKATELDPKNAELQYNLGVIASESGDIEAAKKYYNKALELNPEYVNAYINIAALVLGSEKDIVEEMNGLGTSKKDNLRYDELKEARQQIYRDATPYLIKALEINPKNIDAAKTLMNIYSSIGETAKYKEMKAKVEAIEAGN